MSPALFWLDERTSRRTARETAFQRTAAQNQNECDLSRASTFGSGRNNQLLLKSPEWQIKRIADVSTHLRRND